MSLELTGSTIKSIEWYPHEKPYRGLFKWEWIRISCDEEIMDGDFLICADGPKNTRKLFEMLNQFKNGQKITISLEDLSGTKMVLFSYVGVIFFVIYFVLDLIFETIYGTINGNIGGPLVCCFLLLAMFFLFSSFMWYIVKGMENSKIAHYSRMYSWVFLCLLWMNIIRQHFQA